MGSYYVTGDGRGRKNVRNTSGQRSNSFNSACRNNSFVVPVNNRVINPKMLTLYFPK